MSCKQGPKSARNDRQGWWRPGRGMAALIAGCLVGGGAAWASADHADTGPDRTGVWAMPGGEVPGQAGTVMGQTDRAFTGKRDRFVKKMVRELAEVDEQIEMIDDIIAGRIEARQGERYDDHIERGIVELQNTRAELRYRRADAQEAVDHARVATEDRWPELQRQTRAALAQLELAYDDMMRRLY